ncbi:sigma-E processing peptidase SpoIIGA [Rubeoparvulum massiliense]|uniref:sigma-E processing peptidase SpoIIGA n=1 Tax=Rubeoparvulum massiliense TaxID=1631346 RepID=UPI00065E3B53|nr:sigma-E processing peptidase SpoIIGA [Rubeoparvulum massiliense]
MVVYLDLFLILNGGFNLVLLYFTGRFRQQRISWWRLLLAALIGALYALMILTPTWTFLLSLPIKVLVAAFMCWIAFGFRQFRFYFQILLTFFLLSFSVGGGILGLHYMAQTSGTAYQGVLISWGDGSTISFSILLLGVVLVLWSQIRERSLREKESMLKQWIVEVEIVLFQERITCNALVDTGNRLVDPFSGVPVMLVELKLLQELLPEPIRRLVEQQEQVTMEKLMEVPHEYLPLVRFIPFQGASKGRHLLIAIKPTRLTFVYQGEQRIIEQVWVGIHPEVLATEGSFQAILHPHMIKELKKEVLHA